MQILLGIALIVAGCSLILAGVAVLCWSEHFEEETTVTATGWGFMPQSDAMAEPYEGDW